MIPSIITHEPKNVVTLLLSQIPFDFFKLLSHFFSFSLTWAVWEEKYQTLLDPRIAFEFFQTSSECSSNWSSQKYKILIFTNFHELFPSSLPWNPMGKQKPNSYSSFTLLLFLNLSWMLFQWFSQKFFLYTFEILDSDF